MEKKNSKRTIIARYFADELNKCIIDNDKYGNQSTSLTKSMIRTAWRDFITINKKDTWKNYQEKIIEYIDKINLDDLKLDAQKEIKCTTTAPTTPTKLPNDNKNNLFANLNNDFYTLENNPFKTLDNPFGTLDNSSFNTFDNNKPFDNPFGTLYNNSNSPFTTPNNNSFANPGRIFDSFSNLNNINNQSVTNNFLISTLEYIDNQCPTLRPNKKIKLVHKFVEKISSYKNI